MATNRVQFQRGLSMSEFFERYGTEDKCRQALEAARWPRGFACASCGGAARSVFERGGMRYWQCAACPHQTSLISGTIFQGIVYKWPPPKLTSALTALAIVRPESASCATVQANRGFTKNSSCAAQWKAWQTLHPS